VARERDPGTVGCRFPKLTPLVIHEFLLPSNPVLGEIHESPLPPILVQLEAHEFPNLPKLVLLEAHGPPSFPSRVQHTDHLSCHPHESGIVE